MLDQLISEYHLHPIVDHFTIALLAFGVAAEFLAFAAALLPRSATGWPAAWSQQLRSTALVLMTTGAGAAVLSYFTGDREADRLWDSMSPAAQQILSSTDGARQYLSHAVLGQYLMYAFLLLGVWRVLIELSPRLARWRIAFLITASVAVGALLYQGKTGGELVYEYGVGITRASGTSGEADRQEDRRAQVRGSRLVPHPP
jgi:uncharacterized membrane protein